MVPVNALIAMVVTLLLCFGVPILLWVLVARKQKGVHIAVLAGALGFFIPQIVVRIPLLNIFSGLIGQLSTNVWMLALFLGLSAALFETTGRLLVFRLLLKKRLSLLTGFAAGVGHGGIEAMYLVGFTYVNNLLYSIMINVGGFELFAQNAKLPGETIQAIRDALLGTSPSLYYAAGLERVFTIAFHIAMSVLLAQFILKRKSVLGFLIVTLCHTALDTSVVIVSSYNWTVWQIEALLAAVAALCVVYLFNAKRFFPAVKAPVSNESENAVPEE